MACLGEEKKVRYCWVRGLFAGREGESLDNTLPGNRAVNIIVGEGIQGTKPFYSS